MGMPTLFAEWALGTFWEEQCETFSSLKASTRTSILKAVLLFMVYKGRRDP